MKKKLAFGDLVFSNGGYIILALSIGVGCLVYFAFLPSDFTFRQSASLGLATVSYFCAMAGYYFSANKKDDGADG